MNKNILLILVTTATIVVLGLFFFSSSLSPAPMIAQKSTTSSIQKKENIQVSIKEQQHKNIANKIERNKEKIKRKQKKMDPSIKAVALDHYKTYIIKVIDKNPEDQDIKLSNDPKSYLLLQGKISNKQFTIKIPRAITYSPNLQLEIIDLKTKKKKIIPANFINDLASMQGSNTDMRVEIDFNNPKNTKIKTIGYRISETSALPHL